MDLSVHQRDTGVFTHHRDAEQALHKLRNCGFGNG